MTKLADVTITHDAYLIMQYLDLDVKYIFKSLEERYRRHKVVINNVDDTALYGTVDDKPLTIEIYQNKNGKICYRHPKEFRRDMREYYKRTKERNK